MIIHIQKRLGETPNSLISRFKQENPEYSKEKISFAGRLDPMASGEMILLIGESCKLQPTFIAKKKTYSFTIINGIITDSNDILGIPNLLSLDKDKNVMRDFSLEPKKFIQQFPVYSSRVVSGHPLWWWAKKERLQEIEIPSKECEIYSVKQNSRKLIASSLLLNDIKIKIGTLDAKTSEGFRTQEIISCWQKLLDKHRMYVIDNYTVSVSSGTYIRGICDAMGGTAMDIHRISID